jgi:hypothetical protein
LGNCPFDAVACQARDPVCGLNLRLLQGLIAGLEADARAVLQPELGRCCVAIELGGAAYPRLSREAASSTRAR